MGCSSNNLSHYINREPNFMGHKNVWKGNYSGEKNSLLMGIFWAFEFCIPLKS